jgi:hypothetical protein
MTPSTPNWDNHLPIATWRFGDRGSVRYYFGILFSAGDLAIVVEMLLAHTLMLVVGPKPVIRRALVSLGSSSW